MSNTLYQELEFDDELKRLLGDETISELERQSLVMTKTAHDLTLKEKINSVGWAYKKMMRDAETLQERADELKRKAAVISNRAEWLKAGIKTYLEMNGMEKIESQDFTAKIVKNPPSCEIKDTGKIPSKYITIIPESYKYDKASIKKDLMAEGKQENDFAIIIHSKRIEIK